MVCSKRSGISLGIFCFFAKRLLMRVGCTGRFSYKMNTECEHKTMLNYNIHVLVKVSLLRLEMLIDTV